MDDAETLAGRDLGSRAWQVEILDPALPHHGIRLSRGRGLNGQTLRITRLLPSRLV